MLIDSNQNGEGKTIASVYSVRPKPGAPVSTPLRWDEVNESLDPAAFTMDAVLAGSSSTATCSMASSRQAVACQGPQGDALGPVRVEVGASETLVENPSSFIAS